MDTRLQELTDRIYQDGITKGQEEAKQIVDQAKAEAEKIIADAHKQASQILADAAKKALELQENTNSELKLAANQAIESLKQEVVNLVNGSITAADIKSAMSDKLFLQKAIETAVKNWSVHHDAVIDMNIIVPEKDEKAITEYFTKTAKGVLDKGFSIETVHGIKSGFQIAPADGGYKISFTDQDFINFFQEFLRPKVVEFLFKSK